MRRHLQLAFVLALGASAACDAPQEYVAPWQVPAAAPTPAPEAMYLEMNQGNMAVADAIMNDLWPARGFADAKLPMPLTWTEDPYHDAYFRFMFYSLRHLEHLLYAHTTTHDQRYLDKLVAVLESYVARDGVRPYDGESFDNAHAASYRAMVLVNMFFKLQKVGALSPTLERGIRESLQRLGTFLMLPKSFEAHANHGFTEAAALLVIAHNFPELEGAATWRQAGIDRLEIMRLTNVDADGVDIENSPFYHLLVLGLVSQVASWTEAYEPALGEKWRATERGMLCYVAYVAQPDGALPMLGASQAVTVPSRDAKLFGPLAAFDDEYAWVWSEGKGGSAPKRRAELFGSSGLFVLRAPPTAPRQTFITFDSGGYRTDHSHLDALSITLYSDKVALFPDAGLCTYDLGEDYDYFHGTRSHNTVIVDGKDQSEGGATPGAFGVAGSVSWATGTSTAYAGVIHKRTVVILEQGLVVVTDDLASREAHDYSQSWHLFHGGHAETSGGDVDVTDGTGAKVVLVRSAAAGVGAPVAVKGSGWVSETYGSKVAAETFAYARHSTTASFATLFATGPRASLGKPATLRETRDAATGERVLGVCAYGSDVTVRIAKEGGSDASVVVTDGGGC